MTRRHQPSRTPRTIFADALCRITYSPADGDFAVYIDNNIAGYAQRESVARTTAANLIFDLIRSDLVTGAVALATAGALLRGAETSSNVAAQEGVAA